MRLADRAGVRRPWPDPAGSTASYNCHMPSQLELERKWMQQWNSSARDLALQRSRDLSGLTDAEALAVAENLLSLVSPSEISIARLSWSGLVEQQAAFHRRSPA